MENENNIKLTNFSPGAGWACKLSASDLTQVLSKLNTFNDTSKTVGYDSFDDCSIYQINDRQSIIQSVDFFTPIVDDPYTFGQIAATNSLSDIYAMGGTPLFALNIVGFPSEKLSLNILSKILQGGIDKCKEANINILGGHSIKDDVPKYGLAVTGIIDNNKIIRNNSAQIDNSLILTKPIGTGILTTAIKRNLSSLKNEQQAITIMNTLNDYVAKSMSKYSITACTDITGFGLLGHLNEMCKGSSLSAEIYFDSVPILDGVSQFSKNDVIPGGTKNNLSFIEKDIAFSSTIKPFEKFILADAQTSGGLLIACPENDSKKLLSDLNKFKKFEAKIIGKLISKKSKNIYCNR